MEANAQELASTITLGWNVGNTLEAIGGETNWGNPMVSEELIKLVKSRGFDAIRLPVSWNQYADQETAKIDDAWMDRVKEVVEICIENDMRTIVNIHWDGGWLENNINPESKVANNQKQRAFWEQIATHLRDFDQRLIFASANEPHVETAEQMEVLMSYHQTFVDTVRSTGGKNAYRVLVVQGPVTDIAKTYELMRSWPKDTVEDRLMAEVHYYTPYNFAGLIEEADWGKPFYYWGKEFHSETDAKHNSKFGEEEEALRLLGLMKEQFADRGIPVILGEFGAIHRLHLEGEDLELHLASVAHYLDFVTENALENGLLPFYWDCGNTGDNGFGLFDRDSNSVAHESLLKALEVGSRAGNHYWKVD
ncbi:glycoside hydrolase family 5 protein [Pelagicoccus albus]|uniref:Glycoside hydrolase family 5 protein n=2 Tax=Pelagicoccus albus TaxID=415222 RepID=A0A7X1B818_9BACT|nr:glycoside hydrolase family 5 protein [Pelagicoccus albus]